MAGDPYWNNVVLAMHMDDVGLSDLKGHAVTLNGNAARSSVQSKFGGYSAAFDGTGDYLSVTSVLLGASSDFTIEGWVYRLVAGVDHQIFTHGTNTAAGRTYMYIAADKLEFFINGTSNLLITGTTALLANNWYHVAITRSSNTFRLFVNGVIEASAASTNTVEQTTAIRVGKNNDVSAAQRYFNGYIDDLRVTNGVARYTTNFAPQTEAFPSTPPQISGTVKDSTGAFVARTVRAYRRSDGILTGSTTSNGTTGAFTVSAYDDTAHFVTAFDSGAENAPIFDNITPL